MPATQQHLGDYVNYKFAGPRMNKKVPSCQVPGDQLSHVSGIDGRYDGCLRKFYGMLEVVDLDDVSGMGNVDVYDGVSFAQKVEFQKRGTSTTYQGFVVRWDSNNDNDNEEVCLVYTADGGSTWSRHVVHAGGTGSVASTDAMECVTHKGYLYVAVEGQDTQVVYWNGSAVVSVDAGPGDFATALAALTKASESVDTDYWLRGDGVYQVAWRFYDSTRGIYSALSDVLTVRVDKYKSRKAHGAIYFNAGGGDSGRLVDGDTITINGRVYEADDDSTTTGDVVVDITGNASIADDIDDLVNAINGDASKVVSAKAEASAVFLEADTRGAGGNAYTLAVSEAGANTDDLSVSGAVLTGGGEETSEPEEQCKVVLDFPANDAVVATKVYADFDALFDTIEVFRSIDLGSGSAAEGSILYLEQSIAEAGNWATSGAFDSLQVTIGTVPDEALPFLTEYDPEKDVVTAPPDSGAIGRYQGTTFMGQAATASNPFDTLHSSLLHESAEYFTTYNRREGSPSRGRPLRYLEAGDAMFVLCPSGYTHVYKSAKLKPLQFVDVSKHQGLDGKYAAHSTGNTVVMISGRQLAALNGNDANLATITAVDRLLMDDWTSIGTYVTSGYDEVLKASMFLHSNRAEVLILWHGTLTCGLLEGANFKWLTSGADVAGTGKTRAFLVTSRGLIVSPDVDRTGSGTMWGLSDSYTLNGTATGGSTTTLVDTAATFHADMIGCRVYMIDGTNAGDYAVVESVNVGTGTLTFTTASAFTYSVASGAHYAVCPVPMVLRLPSLRKMDVPGVLGAFDRVILAGAGLKVTKATGFTAGVNDSFRVGAYRNGGTTIETPVARVPVDLDPDDAVDALESSNKTATVDGTDVEPYVELLASGVDVELTDARFRVILES